MEIHEEIGQINNLIIKNVLEIGSGVGFSKDYTPSIFTSEVMEVKNVDLVADTTQLPFPNGSLDASVPK